MSGTLPRVLESMDRAARRPPAMARGEDPDERALTEEMASVLGMEAAIFVPTCTIANQIAVRLWCAPGSTLLAEASAHVGTVERKATSMTGARLHLDAGDRGHLRPEAVEAAMRRAARPSLVWLENTSMRAGGTIMPAGWMDEISAMLRGTDTRLHLDGSRLWNAAAGSDRTMAALAKGADTIAVSLNKAVGAPMGSILAGSREAIDRAAELRGQMGANWRPLGILAAAARSALTDCLDRIARDHEATALLAMRLRASLGSRVNEPDTNIILVQCPGSAELVVEALSAAGVLALSLGPDTVRLVLHHGMRDTDLERLARTVIEAADRPGPVHEQAA